MNQNTSLLFLFLVVLSISACPPNCNDCDPSGTSCFACADGYQLSVLGKCVSNIVDKCTVYGPNNECFVCQPSFSLSNGQCTKQYTGCISPNTNDGSCFQCAFGKALINSLCTGTLNCAEAASPCQACSPGFAIANGNCTDQTGNCQTIQSNGVCSQCKTGYKLIGYKCIAANITVPLCYIYEVANVCLICKNGYSLYQNYCLLPSQIQAILTGAQTLSQVVGNSTTTTTTSNSSTTVTVNTTTTTIIINNSSNSSNSNSGSNSNGGNIPNCLNQNNGLCIQCNQGYIVVSGKCQAAVKNCSAYNLLTGICISCDGGFTLQNQQCILTQTTQNIENCQVLDPTNASNCLICVYGYYPTGSLCNLVSPLCNGFNVQTGACFACLYGLTLQNGVCIDNNCVQKNGNNGCRQCASSYQLDSNNVCQLVDVNCLQTVNSKCNNCKNGYYINVNGICKVLPNNCAAADVLVGSCIQCLPNFNLVNGACVGQAAITIQFCQVVNPNNNNQCQTCISGYYPSGNQCLPISPLCQTYNLSNGNCLSCSNGYNLNNGKCIDPNCLNQQGNGCIQCKNNFRVVTGSSLCVYYDPNCGNLATTSCLSCKSGYQISVSTGLCTMSSTTSSNSSNTVTVNIPNCNNIFNGQCTSCASGYTLSNNQCVALSGGATVVQNRDPNCVNYVNNVCNKCSDKYYIGSSGNCIPVNPLCKSNDATGACTSCFPGYSLTGGICGIAGNPDPNCQSRDSNGLCTGCYNGFYYNITTSKCVGLNPLCKTSNLTNGNCLSCYPGYALTNGLCGVSFKDPNCQSYDSSNNCEQCATKYFLNTTVGSCQPVSPLCQTSSSLSGVCLSCYQGYILQSGQCVIGTNSTIDVNCKTFNNGVCSQCYQGYFIGSGGKCTISSVLCKSSNNVTGVCLSCYPGYILSGGNCVIPNSNQQDVNCKSFVTGSQVCQQCYQGYYINNGICTQYNVLCKTTNNVTGICLSCYQGYSLVNGNCAISITATANNTDLYCISTQGSVCKQCSNGYFLNISGICQQVNPLCKNYDNTTGYCTNCYTGYSVQGTTCAVAAIISIPYCSLVSASGACLQCINGYYVNGTNCSPVSILCASYNAQTGLCTSCIPGYFYQSGICVYPALGQDKACQHYTNAYCDSCATGFYISAYKCEPVDQSCLQFDYVNSVCLACHLKTAQGAKCV